MTTEEFSNEFDVLANSYSLREEFGSMTDPRNFNEYEKSVFLTLALETTVMNLYNGRLTGDSFESTEQMRRYLDSLIKEYEGKDNNIFTLKDDTLAILYEEAYTKGEGCLNCKRLEVVPVAYDELHRTLSNPFKGPNNRRALRIDMGKDASGSTQIKILSKYPIKAYFMKYLAKPGPIILLDLPDGLKIDNNYKKTECELNPALHRMILEMAVKLALASRSTGL